MLMPDNRSMFGSENYNDLCLDRGFRANTSLLDLAISIVSCSHLDAALTVPGES
jgi:hypothetical protein